MRTYVVFTSGATVTGDRFTGWKALERERLRPDDLVNVINEMTKRNNAVSMVITSIFVDPEVSDAETTD